MEGQKKYTKRLENTFMPGEGERRGFVSFKEETAQGYDEESKQ